MPERQMAQKSRGGWCDRTMRRSLLVAALVTTLIAGAGFAVHAANVQKAGTGVAGCFDPVSFGAMLRCHGG